MSEAEAVVAPTEEGKPQMSEAVEVKQEGGAVTLSPAAVGGRRRSRKVSKKVLRALKRMGPAKVAAMLKGGEPAPVGGRRRKTRKGSRRH